MDAYIKRKIKILRQLGIRLTKNQIDHMYSLTSEIAIDNFTHDIIVNSEDDDYPLLKKSKKKYR